MILESKNRFNTYSIKWNVKENELPMWVADMDFVVAKEIRDSMKELVEHGIFGYTNIPKAYFDSVISWWDKRYNFCIKDSNMLFARGVIPALSSILRNFSDENDGILLQSPVYHVFYQIIKDCKRRVIDSPLLLKDGQYEIDFDDLESKLKKSKIFILCSPHNPIGKVWDKETLRQIGHLCHKHNVLVVADEIHCDITKKGIRYTPFASIDSICENNSITAISPGKTFNIADLHTATIIAANRDIYRILKRAFDSELVSCASAFGLHASIAAYTHCEYWLEELICYIDSMKEEIDLYLQREIPLLRLIKSNATYLAWIDCSSVPNVKDDSFCDILREQTGLYISKGASFGENGKGFLRMNIATSKDRIYEGLSRLKACVDGLVK